MHIRIAALCLALVSIGVVACSREPGAAGNGDSPTAASPSWTPRMQPVQAPTGPSTMVPRLTVSDRGVILSWIAREKGRAELRFVERTSSGWSAPATVASGEKWFLSYADAPWVLRRPDGTLLASWLLSTNPLYEGSDLQMSSSQDNGKTWMRPFVPHHDGTDQQHAFPAFFELPGNGLGVMWLDGRDIQPSDAHPEGGPMALRFAEYDAQWRRTREGVVDAMACECCSTTVVTTSEGALTAFRDRSDKEIRDIAVSRLENGTWTPATRVHEDNWETYSCPVNGPVLSAKGRSAAVAWFTVKDEKGQAWAAFSNDAGRTWGQPIRLDDGLSLGRVGIELLDDGSAVASWVESADNRGHFRLRRIQPSGARSDAVTVSNTSLRLAMDTPRMARHGQELVVAWTERADGDESDTAFQVRTAVAALPVTQ